MSVALVQQPAPADKTDNIRRGLAAVDAAAAQGAAVVLFAELAFDRCYSQRPADDDPLRRAGPVPAPPIDGFAERARRHAVVTILNLCERDGARAFDCSR